MIYHQDSDYISLELLELIRLNQLVRGTIDLAGFTAWYDTLTASEQVVLLCYLHEFAQQAGYDEAIVEQAHIAAQISANSRLTTHLLLFRGGCRAVREPEYKAELESDWLAQRPDSERRILLRFLVFLFGYAEGKVYSGCRPAWCNHWWHRDLLDERVVQDLLSNPQFYRTSQKDDLPANS